MLSHINAVPVKRSINGVIRFPQSPDEREPGADRVRI